MEEGRRGLQSRVAQGLKEEPLSGGQMSCSRTGDEARAQLAFFFNCLFFTELSRAAHGLRFF